MYYEPGKAPFHKAIMESGATTARAVLLPTHPRHLVQFREFLIAAGVYDVPEAQFIPARRKLPMDTILRASRKIWGKYEESVCWPFQPAIDGLAYVNGSLVPSPDPGTALIPDLPTQSWRDGRHSAIPVLTGFNTK